MEKAQTGHVEGQIGVLYVGNLGYHNAGREDGCDDAKGRSLCGTSHGNLVR